MKNLKIVSISAIILMALSVCAVATFAYDASEFDADLDVDSVLPGAEDVFLGSIVLPAAASDSLVRDGVGNSVSELNELSTFAASEKYIDSDVDDVFETGDPIVTSADSTLSSTDTVITSSGASFLNSVATSEVGNGVTGYIDANTNEAYDDGEDVARVIVSGSAAALLGGTAVKTFPVADADTEESVMMITGETGLFDFLDPPAIIGYEMSGTTTIKSPVVIRGGSVKFTRFSPTDALCLGDADASGNPNPGDQYWWDEEGTCDSYDDESDIAINLTDDFTTMPASIPLGSAGLVTFFPVTMGYSDADEDGEYDCGRGQLCEAVLYLGGGTDVPTGSLVNTTDPFLVLSGETDVPNAVTTVADYPVEKSATSNFITFDGATVSGEKRYAYIDTDADDVYDAEEDIIELVVSGSDDTLSTGDLFEYFGSGMTFADSIIADDVHGPGEPLIESADLILSAGSLSGSGTDEVIVPSSSGFLHAFASTEMYYDHNASGAYADGDDIVRDIDGSGYYNADVLESLTLTNAVTDFPVTDDDLDGLYVYHMEGGACAGGGVDTLFGSDISAPMLDAPMSGELIVGASDLAAERTVCLYADIASDATIGRYIAPSVAQGDAVFASAASPEDTALSIGTLTGNWVSIYSDGLAAQIEADTYRKSQAAAYTVSYDTSSNLPTGSRLEIVFPAGFDVTSAEIACTDDGVEVTGTSAVSGQTVRLTTSAGAIASGSAVICEISGVVNPTTAGVTDAFSIQTVKLVNTSYFNTLEVSDSLAITVESSSSGRRVSTPVAVDPELNITSPQEGEFLAVPVTLQWDSNVGDFFNIEFRIGSGDWREVATHVSGDEYTFGCLGGDTMEVRVTATDLAIDLASDSVMFTLEYCEHESDEQSLGEEYSWEERRVRDQILASLVKSPLYPTVYYLEDDMYLRPFFEETTFYLWRLNFGSVREVAHETLSNYVLGAPMVPPPGTVLIKSPEAPEVWVMEPNEENPAAPILHWIASEEVAKAYFGNDWATRIIDVPRSLIAMSVQEMRLQILITSLGTSSCIVEARS
jgi:hypothetical protein